MKGGTNERNEVSFLEEMEIKEYVILFDCFHIYELISILK
jgi:hypothetical protein